MKTFTTLALTCCFVAVVALQAVILHNQNRREPVIRYQSVDHAVPQIRMVSNSQDSTDVDSTAAAEEPSPVVTVSLEAPESASTLVDAFPEPEPLPEEELFADAAEDTQPPVTLVEPLSGDFPDTGPAVAEAPPQPGFNPFSEPAAAEEPLRFEEPAAAQEAADVEERQPDPELGKYPIWLLIKPDGVQFLQTEEEIATNHNTIPPHAFLIGCRAAALKAATVADFEGMEEPENGDWKRAFQLNCDVFTLKGSFGTRQHLEVTGDTLEFSTESQQIRLQGKEERSLEFYSVDDSAETRLQADEITLQLHDDGFQITVKGTSSLEINPNPDPNKQAKPKPQPGGFYERTGDTSNNDPFG